MVTKKNPETENPRKRKRIIPTRTAGTPANSAFTNPADELFAEVFAVRNQDEATQESDNDQVVENQPFQASSEVESSQVDPSQVKYGKVNPSQVKHNAPIKQANQLTEEISPSRNFTKFTNSLLVNAIPEKFFRGQSKHTYDILYQHTRGAIKPVRQIQLTKNALMKLTGLSDKTVQTHIKNLKEIGLVITYPLYGSHKGWKYEILMPQEVENLSHIESGKVNPSQVKYGKNLTSLTGKNLTLLDHTNTLENKDTYEFANTLTKTNTNDDDKEAFSEFIKKFSVATKKLTGKNLSKTESHKWEALADLLILELEIAVSRTESISSVPAFLTEVLRRQFFAAGQTGAKQSKVSRKTDSGKKRDIVGRPSEESFEIKPLDEPGREEALLQLQEFAEDDFLWSFSKWYTAEDWQWLIERLNQDPTS